MKHQAPRLILILPLLDAGLPLTIAMALVLVLS